MKNALIKLSYMIGLLLCSHANAQSNTTNTTKATATLSATCSLNSQNLNFGTLLLPLTSQQSSSSINVLCNREAPYTIELAYGGVYGKGTGSGYLYAINSVTSSGSNYSSYRLTVYQDSSRSVIITPGTKYNVNINGLGAFNSYISSLYSCNYTGSAYSCIGSPSYSYGIMSGLAAGDQIAYSITVPGDNNKVWNAGQGSYTGVGTGTNQSIPVNGKIIPSNSSSTYPAPDYYLDTVTATVTY